MSVDACMCCICAYVRVSVCLSVCVYVRVCVRACVLQYKPLTYRITNLMKTHPSFSQLKLDVDHCNQMDGTCLHISTHVHKYVCIVVYYISSRHKPAQILLYIIMLAY